MEQPVVSKPEKTEKQIALLSEQIVSLTKLYESGMSSVTKRDVHDLREKLKKEQCLLKKLKRESERQHKQRANMREKLDEVCELDPNAAKILKSFNRQTIGRPRIEVENPELLSAIMNIVEATSASDPRRRCETLRSVTTLDDLHAELIKRGTQISRSATYLRLIPKRGNTLEGKRHVSTVPVKLLRPENSLRKTNVDRMFAKSFVDDIFSVAKLFGPDAVLFLSNDDKARVPLGLAAANLQAPILMHMEYKVRLPDHSFVVVPKHQLIPSVYAVCDITEHMNIYNV